MTHNNNYSGVFLSLGKVENQVMAALADRILRAFDDKEPFLVVIVMPLKPEFLGKWEGDTGAGLQSVAYLNYATIKRAKDSLFSRLTEKRPNGEKSQLHD